MGFADGFAYESAADIFREHAALSAFENDGTRDFDLGALATIDDAAFDALEPATWPLRAGEPAEETRFFGAGGFFTPDRKARFIAPESPALRSAADHAYPFVLNTGRVRDQWHTMTRSGLSPRLGQHMPEPFVEIHPADARFFGLADFARVATAHGAGTFRVRLSEEQQRGALFVPIHWSSETASSARICELVAPHTDPFSGQPEAKATPASIAPVAFTCRGFALTRARFEPPAGTWWSRVALDGGIGTLLATNDRPELWRDQVAELMAGELAEFVDLKRGIYRAAAFRAGRLESALFLGPAESAPQWDAVKVLFETPALADIERRMVLSGRAADGLVETGPVICACFGVGLGVIRDAIASRCATDVEAIGKALRAGTNCGSCLPELKRIVHEHAHPV
jgi:assimilatory nitrate reductase catalytic subunit